MLKIMVLLFSYALVITVFLVVVIHRVTHPALTQTQLLLELRPILILGVIAAVVFLVSVAVERGTR